MKKKLPIPTKLSTWLRAAVQDARALDKPRSGYFLDMSIWHASSSAQEDCAVCMGGAIMARRLGVPHGEYQHPSYIDDDYVRRGVYAVDNMRQGRFADAYHSFMGKYVKDDSKEGLALDRARILVRNSYRPFAGRSSWSIYLQAADILQEAGL